MINLKSLGILGVPTSIDILLNGSIYTAILDSVPAHLSIIIQALKSNLAAGNTCVLVTQMTPGVFLSRAEMSGVDFREDIIQSRLYLFSQECDCASNIFRHGIKRFLQEFDYFKIPKGSFFLFDQAVDLFTMNDQNIAQTQALDYRDWMRSKDNTALFLFLARGEKISESILGCFNGVARINQSKTGIEMLIDFWYSQDSAIAAKAFPVSLDTTGLIRIDPLLPQTGSEEQLTDNNSDDRNTIFYFGPDFESFSASIPHNNNWIHTLSFVDLIHLSRDAVRATIVISLSSNSDLIKIAKIVHYLRLNQGCRLRIVIRESGFSLRYPNELLLLRFGANLIIHQQVAKQQIPLLWEMLAGQTYNRNINKNFDLTLSSILTSSYKGYVDLVTFCNESLCMLERGEILDIPLTLIVAGYHEHTSPADTLGQINVVRNGDIVSSDATHCYIFIHACAEENSATALARITRDKQASLFLTTRFITSKEGIRETLLLLVQSGNIALAPDFHDAIAQSNRARNLVESNNATGTSMEASINSNDINLDSNVQNTFSVEETQMMSSVDIAQPLSPDALLETKERTNDLATLMNRLAPQAHVTESMRWSRK